MKMLRQDWDDYEAGMITKNCPACKQPKLILVVGGLAAQAGRDPAKDYDELNDFLHALDGADVTPSDWEIDFLESVMDRGSFTDRQAAAIRKMMDRYEDEI
jgi:hypothetical protein